MKSEQIYRVELRNSGSTIDVRSDQSIYEAALNEGIQLPIGCNYGGCITCAAKLITGKVKQPGATALNSRRSQAGYILLCVARPQTDCVIEEGVESHDQLYENPFTGKISPI
ncbi:MAG: 2Fe-2S iron-sulfur cluster binding domain-containing protein [Acidiferrobacterales bacterium]|nr:2Fe-2S iron-sulfur cluster binding domain-containing protein [Acidiferrobacterales bacterium]